MRTVNVCGFIFHVFDNAGVKCYSIPGYIRIRNMTQLILQIEDFCKKIDVTFKYDKIPADGGFLLLTFTKKSGNGQRRLRKCIDRTTPLSSSGFENLFERTLEKIYEIFMLDDETNKQEDEEMDKCKELLNSFYGLNSPHAFSFSNGWCYKHDVDIRSLIKKVIFNDPATIIIWKDDTKTIVKCGENEQYDPEKGVAMAIAKKCLGDKGNYYETFKKYLPKEI